MLKPHILKNDTIRPKKATYQKCTGLRIGLSHLVDHVLSTVCKPWSACRVDPQLGVSKSQLQLRKAPIARCALTRCIRAFRPFILYNASWKHVIQPCHESPLGCGSTLEDKIHCYETSSTRRYVLSHVFFYCSLVVLSVDVHVVVFAVGIISPIDPLAISFSRSLVVPSPPLPLCLIRVSGIEVTCPANGARQTQRAQQTRLTRSGSLWCRYCTVQGGPPFILFFFSPPPPASSLLFYSSSSRL